MLDGRVRVPPGLEVMIDIEPLLFGAERPAKGTLGKAPAEVAQPGLAIGSPFAHAGQLTQVGHDVTGGLNGRVGRGLVPGTRHRGSALVADAAVIGRERRLDDERFGEAVRREVALRNDLGRPLRQLPFQGDRRLDPGRLALVVLRVVHALLALGELQPQRVDPAAQQKDRAAIFRVLPRFDPGVDEGFSGIVQPEPGGVLGADDELVFAGLGSQDGPLPANGKCVDLKLLRLSGRISGWSTVPKVEVYFAIDSFDQAPSFLWKRLDLKYSPRKPRCSSQRPGLRKVPTRSVTALRYCRTVSRDSSMRGGLPRAWAALE